MTYLKYLSRVSKEKLALLFEVCKSEVEVIEHIVEPDEIFDLCSDEFDLINYAKKEYSFRYKMNNMYTDKTSLRASKTMIKLYIYLHFIVANKSGVRKNVAYSFLADSLNVSVATIKKCLDKLAAMNFIWVCNTGRGLCDIVIVDEYKMHESDAKGYITISSKLMRHFLGFENVNELKVEIKKMLWCDAKVNFTEANITFNKNNLFKALPDYLSEKDKDALLNSDNSIFKFEDNTINFAVYKKKNEMVDSLREEYRTSIEGFFELSGLAYSKYHSNKMEELLDARTYHLSKELIIDDLIGLAIQYNIYYVLAALQDLYINYGGVGVNEIRNTAGYVRNKINELVLQDKLVS